MSGRNRARGNANQDNDDQERRLWEAIQERSKEVSTKEARSNEIGHEIIDVEEQQAQLIKDDKLPSASLDERLEKLYREKIKLAEDVQHIIDGNGEGMNLLDSINVLAALRTTSESSAAQKPTSLPPSQRAASGKLSRVNKKTNPAKPTAAATIAATLPPDDLEDIPAAPSPKIIINAPRLVKEKPSRATSVSVTREPSVKLEADGAESVASSTDGIAPSSTTASASKSSFNNRTLNRIVLTKGEIVFCRHNPAISSGPDATEGEGILCRVTAVIGEGKQRRYEVQDADPSGETPPPTRASVAQLIQIPGSNKGLMELGKGRNVLAQYPDTTTFYKAEVVEAWKQGSEEVRLKFEDDDQPRGVERRFVLTEK